MKNAFDATVEIVVAALNNATITLYEGSGNEVSAFAQAVYDKMKELEKDKQASVKIH